MRNALVVLLSLCLGGSMARNEPAGPKVGEAVASIRLNDQHGRATAVGKNKKGLWSVVAFYPKAATPG